MARGKVSRQWGPPSSLTACCSHCTCSRSAWAAALLLLCPRSPAAAWCHCLETAQQPTHPCQHCQHCGCYTEGMWKEKESVVTFGVTFFIEACKQKKEEIGPKYKKTWTELQYLTWTQVRSPTNFKTSKKVSLWLAFNIFCSPSEKHVSRPFYIG